MYVKIVLFILMYIILGCMNTAQLWSFIRTTRGTKKLEYKHSFYSKFNLLIWQAIHGMGNHLCKTDANYDIHIQLPKNKVESAIKKSSPSYS